MAGVPAPMVLLNLSMNKLWEKYKDHFTANFRMTEDFLARTHCNLTICECFEIGTLDNIDRILGL